ncbi:MAG: hypothetical protein P8M30_01590 [Planctomycetaceae bacterium]|nr:hypothetical protein [bacterium]MDC0273769.1 hypothetical protein [Planctomycetaceae bacterium]MDG2387987.1 hypothetical protein [Planctomycetaceae bacterium]
MFEIELEVGSVLMIGETALTIVDIEGDDVTFNIDSTDGDENLMVTISQESLQNNNSSSSFPALPR